MLQAVNLLSPRSFADHAAIEEVPYETLVSELGWTTGGAIWAVAEELSKWGYARGFFAADGSVRLRATFRGLVWETRRGVTLESQFIDGLLAEGETTSVEFKREVHLDTADQKAEFIKDILSLANTRASGRRWLVIGFDDKTRTYFGSPDPTLTQQRIEQILARYTTPCVEVRYDVVQCQAGPVGKLEVLRDPKNVPYRVAKSITGNKKIVLQDQIFVRHGSQVETPTAAEEQALVEEGVQARAL